MRYANGIQVDPNSLTAVSAYIQQDDLFLPTLTVHEHLTFQACVRMDPDVPHKQRMERVESVAKEVRARPTVTLPCAKWLSIGRHR